MSLYLFCRICEKNIEWAIAAAGLAAAVFSTVVRKNPTTKSENFRYSSMYELCDNKDRKRLQIFVDGFGEADIGQSEEWKS